ncbi:uncharacterized protein MONBRDRAFT_23296 [Monosiga brevicollis MX1]|uniref:Protein arginine methyltransferase NDUFAF7 n=1 Tax=Monosiga brevicollis TaxID=81824 RepID=A9USZ6_MONBE|nr:uncharacterized protein MONBRDRAFT_23296 [Monosiga brevicollis MX1]EDQ91155.1 predicted protein [Monosiga brevicollis MX1]|eukprot:XP_001743577.1 hypothetical protein [Monosiga brevicollis MX1]
MNARRDLSTSHRLLRSDQQVAGPLGTTDELLDHIVTRIELSGPLSIADYMQEVLTSPIAGYYSRDGQFGGQGDFITAPGVSHMFGEVLDKHLPATKIDINLIESSLLLSAEQEATICNRERTSPAPLQDPSLPGPYRKADADRRQLRWFRRLDQLLTENADQKTHGSSLDPVIVVANEFLDAAPIYQLQYQNDQWHERLVDVNPDPAPGELPLRSASPAGLPL